MLLLIATYWYQMGAVEENIGRHQDGISEEAVFDVLAFVHRGLVGVGALEHAHRSHRSQHPREFRHLGQIALTKENRTLWIESGGEIVEGDRMRVLPTLRGISNRRHRVVVGDEVEGRIVFVLQCDELAEGAEIVAEMEILSGRLRAREDA